MIRKWLKRNHIFIREESGRIAGEVLTKAFDPPLSERDREKLSELLRDRDVVLDSSAFKVFYAGMCYGMWLTGGLRDVNAVNEKGEISYEQSRCEQKEEEG